MAVHTYLTSVFRGKHIVEPVIYILFVMINRSMQITPNELSCDVSRHRHLD
jgi:hypothetical protein